MEIINLDAAAARAMFPDVVGTILGAELHSGFAILDMGRRAFGVMVGGKFVACCPTYRHAKRAGEREANRASPRMVRLRDRRITNGRNVWTVTATLRAGRVDLETIHGDITDTAGIREALVALIATRSHYKRTVGALA